jgi:hypothetical protein
MEIAGKEHSEHYGIDNADGCHFHCGCDAIDDGGRDQKWQDHRRRANDGRSYKLCARCGWAARRRSPASRSGVNRGNQGKDAGRRGDEAPDKKIVIETPVTTMTEIRIMLGGMVSAIAPEAARTETPRFFTLRYHDRNDRPISAAFEPEIPDTRYMLRSSTYDNPFFTSPMTRRRNSIIARDRPVMSISKQRNINNR